MALIQQKQANSSSQIMRYSSLFGRCRVQHFSSHKSYSYEPLQLTESSRKCNKHKFSECLNRSDTNHFSHLILTICVLSASIRSLTVFSIMSWLNPAVLTFLRPTCKPKGCTNQLTERRRSMSQLIHGLSVSINMTPQ